MEVIGAGPGRTATLSLKRALDELGYNTYHMEENFKNYFSGARNDMRAWSALYELRRLGKSLRHFVPHFKYLFEGVENEKKALKYSAAVDFPASLFYAELAQAYPNAKVVLTRRDADSWVRSVAHTIYHNEQWRRTPLIGALFYAINARVPFSPLHDTLQVVGLPLWREFLYKRNGGGGGGGAFDLRAEPALAAKLYEQWNDDVLATVERERVLVFHPRDGWAPLCAFLGKPVPATPFPNVNDTAQFQQKIAKVKWIFFGFPTLLLGVVFAAFYILYRLI